jgi:superfamily II DNA or RNA helicase
MNITPFGCYLNKMSNYIYIRINESYEKYNAVKVGCTTNILNRECITWEIVRGKFILVAELDCDCKYVEKILQDELIEDNIYLGGGTEFYNKIIISKVIPILDRILHPEEGRNIKYKLLSDDDIDCLERKLYNDKIDFRKEKQNEYLRDILIELEKFNKCFVKAPTGFGKTHLYYQIIKALGFNKILFLTPRRNLNIQLLESKYVSKYLNINDYDIIHFSHKKVISNNKEYPMKNYEMTNDKYIITCCYQSYNRLMRVKIDFDIVIYDEAHYISNWVYANNGPTNVLLSNISEYKIFASATPTENIEINQNIFGNIIEKVKVYELINNEILCNIITLVKKLDNIKKEYHDLKNLIIDCMNNFNKKKGIIYVNNTNNAKMLYDIMKKEINTYIYVSKNIDVDSELDKDIYDFENNDNPCIIIVVGKISYGYDNPFIDFICFGDPRQSDIDIRQILGRGLRWNKKLYPNKYLHVLVPLYKDEFGLYQTNESLKNYLNYIIGECGQDIIFKNADIGSNDCIIKNMSIQNNKIYEGEIIPFEILKEYSTNFYNMYSNFIRLLKNNKVYDENKYNEFKKRMPDIPDLCNLQNKYKKFNFQSIHPDANKYYSDKKQALEAIKNIDKSVNNKKILPNKKIMLYNCNPLIPPYNLDLYYGL